MNSEESFGFDGEDVKLKIDWDKLNQQMVNIKL
jgi:hypothetical protein